MSHPKKLYRSKTNRMIAGVCGGLGEYFAIDPTLIRLALTFFTMWLGIGLLFYLIAWFIIPEEKITTPNILPKDKKNDEP